MGSMLKPEAPRFFSSFRRFTAAVQNGRIGSKIRKMNRPSVIRARGHMVSLYPYRHTRTLVNQGFFLFAHTQIPKPHPNDTQLSRFRGQVADEGLHPVGAFATHGRRHVSVAIQRECRGVMPHVFLQSFDVIPCHDAVHGKRVPLRYNKDKRKNPVFSRVSAFVVAYSIPFPTLIVNEKSVE